MKLEQIEINDMGELEARLATNSDVLVEVLEEPKRYKFFAASPDNGRDYSLDELQKAVCGYIETVNVSDNDRLLVGNEEGALRCLPTNWVLFDYCQKHSTPHMIFGNVLITKKSRVL